jgi:hypothetical protein
MSIAHNNVTVCQNMFITNMETFISGKVVSVSMKIKI